MSTKDAERGGPDHPAVIGCCAYKPLLASKYRAAADRRHPSESVDGLYAEGLFSSRHPVVEDDLGLVCLPGSSIWRFLSICAALFRGSVPVVLGILCRTSLPWRGDGRLQLSSRLDRQSLVMSRGGESRVPCCLDHTTASPCSVPFADRWRTHQAMQQRAGQVMSLACAPHFLSTSSHVLDSPSHIGQLLGGAL
jgi:hypothetical protein